MPLRTRLLLGLALISVCPLLFVGWLAVGQVRRARRAAVTQVQEACEESARKVHSLSRHAARQKAEEIARELSAFLRERPEARLCDLAAVESLVFAAKQDFEVGCLTSIDVLLNDERVPYDELRVADAAAERDASGRICFRAPSPGGEPNRPFTHVAAVPGTNLRVAATTQDRSVRSVVDELGRTIHGISENAELATHSTLDELKAVFVLGIVAAVAGVMLVSGHVSRAVTRPIGKLTAAAEAISAGRHDGDLDLDIGGSHEVRVIAGAFERALAELRAQAAALRAKNGELVAERQRAEAARCEAQQANRQLRGAQDEMVQMEKMSSLGRLVAGIAHEINTPTGAIHNVTAAAGEYLEMLTDGLDKLHAMPPEDFAELRRFLQVAVRRQLRLERVSREDKRTLRDHLRRAQIPRYREFVDLLCKCHVTDFETGERLARLLAEYDVGPVFTALLEIHAGTAITRTSAEKIGKIVRALRFYSHGHGAASGQRDAERDGGVCEDLLTDVNQSVQDALVILNSRIKHCADMDLRLDDGLPLLPCRGGLTEVWVNLLTNACDAIGERAEAEGGAELRRGTLTVETRRDGESVVVTVFDDGVPFPADSREKLFDPFFTTKPPGQGTGLGLCVVMSTVGRNGGSIRLLAEPDAKGVEVRLPMRRREGDKPETESTGD
jgi:signal transduction histidine kinase